MFVSWFVDFALHTARPMSSEVMDKFSDKFSEKLQQDKNNEFIDAVNRASMYDIERFRPARLLEPLKHCVCPPADGGTTRALALAPPRPAPSHPTQNAGKGSANRRGCECKRLQSSPSRCAQVSSLLP
jgi:hypothetical protein